MTKTAAMRWWPGRVLGHFVTGSAVDADLMRATYVQWHRKSKLLFLDANLPLLKLLSLEAPQMAT